MIRIYRFSHGFGDYVEEDEEYEATGETNIVVIDESTLGFSCDDEWTGTYLSKWHENIDATYKFLEWQAVSDFVANDLAWFLVSERLKDLLVSLEIQGLAFHPLKVKCINREGYDFTAYLCNILTSIDESAIDLERSKYFVMDIPEVVKSYGRPIIHVSICVLKSEMVKGHDIFRTTNSMAIYVSERVKDAIEKSGLTGCWFNEIEVV